MLVQYNKKKQVFLVCLCRPAMAAVIPSSQVATQIAALTISVHHNYILCRPKDRGMTSFDSRRWLLPAGMLSLYNLDKQWTTCLSDVTRVCQPTDSTNRACSKYCGYIT